MLVGVGGGRRSRSERSKTKKEVDQREIETVLRWEVEARAWA